VHLAIRRQNALAELSDTELADRLDRACARYDAADRRRQATAAYWTCARAAKYPGTYRFWTTLTGSPGFRVIEWVVKLMIFKSLNDADFQKIHLLATDEAIAMDSEIDEISAITREIQRRIVEQRRMAAAT
jgi:hypothetical protein